MNKRNMKDLSPGYTSEVDEVDEKSWYQFLAQFDDANIFQTWAYGMVTGGRRRMSHLVIRRNGAVSAIAQPRIVKMPLINAGIAYVRWGPLWRLRGTDEDAEIFRQAVRALRNEYACKRGLVLRLFPHLYDDNAAVTSEILKEEGFSSPPGEEPSRTILMDLSPTLDALNGGMKSNWKRNLKAASRSGLKIMGGSDDDLFKQFLGIYKEMVSRKGFVPGADVHEFRLIQAQLPDDFKMKILLCVSESHVCAGLISSTMGNSAIYLFGATSDAGMKSNGSHLLHWKLIEDLKRCGVSVYNLYGINPEKNPGTYRFKSELAGKNGREVSYLGRIDSHANFLSHGCLELGENVRSANRALKDLIENSFFGKHWFKTAH